MHKTRQSKACSAPGPSRSISTCQFEFLMASLSSFQPLLASLMRYPIAKGPPLTMLMGLVKYQLGGGTMTAEGWDPLPCLCVLGIGVPLWNIEALD